MFSREARDLQEYPSLHLQDLVTFLTNVTNAALLNLPESIKSLLYYDALEHLSQSMKTMLLDPDLRVITEVALKNFNTDVRFIEDFVHNLGDPTVRETFLELRQVWSAYNIAAFTYSFIGISCLIWRWAITQKSI